MYRATGRLAYIKLKEIEFMAYLTRYNPFNDRFDDLLSGFFLRPSELDEQTQPRATIRMDVTENDKAYVVYAEVPGAKKEDVHVTIDGNQVAISAETSSRKEQKDGEKVLRTERSYGKAYRAFTLAQDVDDSSAEAKYVDGVLELTLPKKAASSATRLMIQ
jgi:HSP20 family protein